MNSASIRDRLEYYGLLFAVVPWYYLPRSLSLRLGSFLGWFVAHFIPIRRSVVESNIKRAFPEKTSKEVRRIAVRTYRHFGRLLAEFNRQDRYSLADLEKIITQVDKKVLDKAFEDGKGVITLTGHFGNWEIMAYWMGKLGYPISAVQRPQNNPLVDQFIRQKRTAGDMKLISIFASVSSYFSTLQNGSVLYILADQDARSRGVFVDFFDIPSSTPRGVAVFAHKLDSPIILCFPVMMSDNTYRFIFEELHYTASNSNDAVRVILQHYMDRLQYYVSQHPEQYFWFHRRWKTQPKKQESTESIAPSLAGAPG